MLKESQTERENNFYGKVVVGEYVNTLAQQKNNIISFKMEG